MAKAQQDQTTAASHSIQRKRYSSPSRDKVGRGGELTRYEAGTEDCLRRENLDVNYVSTVATSNGSGMRKSSGIGVMSPECVGRWAAVKM